MKTYKYQVLMEDGDTYTGTLARENSYTVQDNRLLITATDHRATFMLRLVAAYFIEEANDEA